MSISEKYQPKQAEDKWYSYWLQHGFFKSVPDEREPYTIVIPPPNVTGVLHMGHMLNNTIQDVLIRRARMKGKNACWVPGTDHASIATEAKVVALLKEQGISKHDLTREEFLSHAWVWKEKYGGIILDQLKKLGASCDWDRTRFTMDADLSEAVIDTFIHLYKKGQIYRGVRMVNWDPQGKTAVSDEEVIRKEVNQKLYYIRYQVSGSEYQVSSKDDANQSHDLILDTKYLVIATTRPETIMADAAICINPNDERYTHLHGKKVYIPLINREIPVILDEYVTMDFGTGCLKVTPAHDLNDYELGQKHHLPVIDILNDDGTLNAKAQILVGEDRFAARKKIAVLLEEAGALAKVEDYKSQVGFSERTNAAIEPKLSMQWFCKMDDMAKPALDYVLKGDIKLIPEKFVNTYRYWMENVKDWCISRQLWWGQQIPAWYLPNGQYVVAKTAEEALIEARKLEAGSRKLELNVRKDDSVTYYKWHSPNGQSIIAKTRVEAFEQLKNISYSNNDRPKDQKEEKSNFIDNDLRIEGTEIYDWYLSNGELLIAKTKEEALQEEKKLQASSFKLQAQDLVQDEDVLDTWFSSWLWPISVFDGFKDPNNDDINYYYPTNDLVTGPDILFFWVARMIMAGHEFRGEIPFKNVYLTGIVRDKMGRKMSKTLGNSPDALELIEKYGADGVRVGMLLSSAAGNDLLFDESKCDQGRSFGNKIWNAFKLLKGWAVDESLTNPNQVAIQWFDSRFNQALTEIEEHFSQYRLSDALMATYKLVWDDFCAWYLEMIKPVYNPEAEKQAIDKETYEATVGFFENILKALHPFMPFISEELWHDEIFGERTTMDCCIVAQLPAIGEMSARLLAEIEVVKQLVTEVRNVRNAKQLSPKEPLPLSIKVNSGIGYTSYTAILSKLVNLSSVEYTDSKIADAANFMVGTDEFFIALSGSIDVEAERARLMIELEYLEGFLKSVNVKLQNERFVQNAKPEVVANEQKKKADAETKIKIIQERLSGLAG